jgi:hypothetical protein
MLLSCADLCSEHVWRPESHHARWFRRGVKSKDAVCFVHNSAVKWTYDSFIRRVMARSVVLRPGKGDKKECSGDSAERAMLSIS